MGKVHAVHPGWKGLLIAAAIITQSVGEAAVESVSTHFVSTATSIAANAAPGSRVTMFSLPGVTPVAAAGRLTAVATTTIQDANANWTTGKFNGNNGAYYIEFDSGFRMDIVGTDAATKTLTVSGVQTSMVAPGMRYRIRRHLTVADIFGRNDEAGLTPAANSADGDNILIHVPQTQQLLTIFYSNVPGFAGWYFDNYTPAANLVVSPEAGLMVRNKSSRALTMYFNGAAKEVSTLSPIYPGYNLIGTLKAQHGISLSQLGLFTGDPNTGLASGQNPSAADNLILLNADGSTRTFFYSDYPGFDGWYDTGFLPSANAIIPPGSAFFVQRKTPRSAFYWLIPGE